MKNYFKTNKLIIQNLIILFSCFCIMCFLSACNTDDAETVVLKKGKYFLTNSNTTYIEVLSEDKLIFVNVDFTEDAEFWASRGYNIDFEENMLGQKDYIYDEMAQTVSVPIIKGSPDRQIFFVFKYINGNQLEYENLVYILSEE